MIFLAQNQEVHFMLLGILLNWEVLEKITYFPWWIFVIQIENLQMELDKQITGDFEKIFFY